MERFGMEDGQELEHPWLNKSIENAQKKVEQRNYVWRKRVLDYDNVMNQQREVVYGFRTDALNHESPRELIYQALEEAVPVKVDEFFQEELPNGKPNIDGLYGWVNTIFPINLTPEQFDFAKNSPEAVSAKILTEVKALYDQKMQGETPEAADQLERHILIESIDHLWQDHLYAMDGLREGIHLVSMGQKDPLIEYKKEAFVLFKDLMHTINVEICHNMFRRTTNVENFEQFLKKLSGLDLHSIADSDVDLMEGEPLPTGQPQEPLPIGRPASLQNTAGGVSFMNPKPKLEPTPAEESQEK
jgi:preprotein translocase subunit SecA